MLGLDDAQMEDLFMAFGDWIMEMHGGDDDDYSNCMIECDGDTPCEE